MTWQGQDMAWQAEQNFSHWEGLSQGKAVVRAAT